LVFIKRKILLRISRFLEYKEAIVIYGARQVGKTTIMKMLIKQLKDNGIPDEAVFYFDDGKIRNIMKFNNFLRILADQTGNLLNIDELASSVGIARETVYDYLTLLEGTYIARRLAPFFRNLRSELTKMPKIYFEDSGVLNYLKYDDIVEKVSGQLLENSIYAELRKVVGLESLRYWRTQSKQEIDFVVEHRRQLFAFEVKKIYSGQKTTSLRYFSQKYPNSKSFVITLEKRREAKENISVLYCWEIYNKF